ncbi:hypothetical protein EOD42_11545 [Rhodovarius crocodyli]|uniref:Uncharacterized protein n=1 Tax=Rhodovarius crocodyli TaxID=1979269 RepID=A0A437MH78_9PROT|nr:hypothetical protein [Rhodovarius crocodyli]RVT97020.1 hypothetical protein EOD42_11545 [Rhodovarius crocodyli]
MRRMAVLMIALGLCWQPAFAQTRVVVPEGSRVVVPSRGAGQMPRATARRAPSAAQGEPWGRGTSRSAGRFSEDEGFSLGGTGLAVPLAILPLAAAAALGATLPGGGGGTSAPARTR